MRALAALLIACTALRGAELRLSEIMYHPPDGEEYEFLELVAIEGGDCSGIALTGAIEFRFPEGVVIETGTHVLLAADPEALRRRYDAYAGMQDATIFAYAGNLSNGGEEIALLDATGLLVERVSYDDDPPWDFLADGFGAALGRACVSAEAALPENWHAHAPTPAEGGDNEQCPPVPRPMPAVVINEVMYHPNGDGVDERLYEFVEIHNATAAEIPLAGWRLAGDVVFHFAADHVLAPHDYLVIAARPALLLSAYRGLAAAKVVGPFEGTLDNGGAKVALIDTAGAGIDSVSYDDDFPWPIAADGYGTTPGRGASLERVCPTAHASLVANWSASPRDQATPGAANTQTSCDLPLCVLSIETAPAVAGAPIDVTIHLSEPVPASDLRLAYFAKRRHSDLFNPEAIDFAAAGDHRIATLPAFEADTWIRWRIEYLFEDEWTMLAPRADEPRDEPWFALFVPPAEQSSMPIYHLFITPLNWARIYKNALDGRCIGDTVLDSWDATVPALFACGDRAFDVRVRFQGSQWQRAGGCDATAAFACERPADFMPAKLLSFWIGFPKYDQFQGRKALILNKQHDWRETDFRFHGLQARLGFRLFKEAGVAAPDTRFARLRVNGCDFQVVLEIERPDEEFVATRFATEGDLFKANGCPRSILWGSCGGPFDWADGRVLAPHGVWTADELYAWNYERKTRRFDSHAILKTLIEELDAVSQDPAQLGEALERNFAVDDTLTYIAAANWACAWDDAWQNYYLHKSGDDGRWRIFPWDMDQCFGGPSCCANVSATASVWRGRSDCPDNWEADPGAPVYSRFKDYFLRAFPDAYLFYLCAFNETVCVPERLAQWARADAAELRGELAHTLLPLTTAKIDAYEKTIVDFVYARHAYVEELFVPRVDPGAGAVGFAGEPIALDATASDPPPGPDVQYTWSNGTTGATPAVTFQDPGTYELTLTIRRTLRMGGESVQVARSAATLVRVLPSPRCYFPSQGSVVTFEAESYHAVQPGMDSFAGCQWQVVDSPAASGGAAVRATGPGFVENPSYALLAPEIDFWIEIEWPAGPRTLWLRATTGLLPRRVYVGADHQAPALAIPTLIPSTGEDFAWYATTVIFKQPGRRLLSVWLADADLVIDKCIVTADAQFVPADAGPPERPARCGLHVFIRGDANRDGTLNLADAISILSFLFRQLPTVACGDHADANDDGALNIADPVYLLQYLFARGPAPRRPYPAPGLDATPNDRFTCGD